MNKFVVCRMDKRKTEDELRDNYKAAMDAMDAASAAASYAYGAAHTYAEFWLNEYFKITGEDREAYQKEADK